MHPHNIRQPYVVRLMAGAVLVVATTLLASPSTRVLAHPDIQAAPIASKYVLRPISDDPRIDQNMVVLLLGIQFNATWPSPGQITTYFGEVDRYSPRGHSGLDIAAPEGTPILAADAGEVIKAYWNQEGYGGLVIIAHPSGYETWYGHLDSFEVALGDQVRRGQQIALMGSTGFSTGSHLHFEVRQDGQLCDPLDFLEQADLKPAAD